MNKSIIKPAIFSLGAAILSACGFRIITGSGHVVSEVRQVANFDSVVLAGYGDVIVTQGDQEGLTIEAEDNLLPYLKTEVNDGVLKIDIDHMEVATIKPTQPLRFYVSMKNVSSLGVTGSGNITSKQIITQNLALSISGLGEANINNLKTDSLTTKISGSGKCTIAGEALSQNTTISGVGTMNTADLASQDVKINVSGSGKSYVKASNTLDVNISGTGNVTYGGSPKLSQHISGLGSIRPQ